MKLSRRPQFSEDRKQIPFPVKFFLGGTLFALAIGGAYYWGTKASDKNALSEEEMRQLKEGADKNKELIRSLEARLAFTRNRLTDAVSKRDLAVSWMEAAQGVEDGDDLDEVCFDVQEKVNLERLNEIAGMLGIQNQNDKDLLLELIGRGYVNIESISSDGMVIVLSDPTIDPEAEDAGVSSEAYAELEDPVGNIPEEYREEEEKLPPAATELEEAFESGSGEEMITDYNLDSAIADMREDTRKIIEEPLRNFQDKFALLDDQGDQKALFCNMIATLYKREQETHGSDEVGQEPDNSDGNKIVEAYMMNAGRVVGLDDFEECALYVQDPTDCHCD
jgi:uncharacterized protein